MFPNMAFGTWPCPTARVLETVIAGLSRSLRLTGMVAARLIFLLPSWVMSSNGLSVDQPVIEQQGCPLQTVASGKKVLKLPCMTPSDAALPPQREMLGKCLFTHLPHLLNGLCLNMEFVLQSLTSTCNTLCLTIFCPLGSWLSFGLLGHGRMPSPPGSFPSLLMTEFSWDMVNLWND